MKFIAQLNGGSFISLEADRMEKTENMVLVYNGASLVCMADIGVILECHLSKAVAT